MYVCMLAVRFVTQVFVCPFVTLLEPAVPLTHHTKGILAESSSMGDEKGGVGVQWRSTVASGSTTVQSPGTMTD